MKFKYLLWLIALLITYTVVISSCKSRKTNLELEKVKTESKVKSELNFQEQTIDKSSFEKFLKENNFTLTYETWEGVNGSLNPIIGQLADNSKYRTNSRYSKLTLNSASKEQGEKGAKEAVQNKSLQAKKDSNGIIISKKKEKRTEAKGMYVGFGFLLVVVALIWIFWKPFKEYLKDFAFSFFA